MTTDKKPRRSSATASKARPKTIRRPIRIAIIGTGRMAKMHVQNYRKIKGCEIVAGIDVDRDRAEAFCAMHGIKTFDTDLDAFLKRGIVDAVSIVTPDISHTEISIKCLNAGLHVLCEKPLALNHADARRMVAAAHKAGTVNMVNFSYRDWPCIQGVVSVVQSGQIGEIRHVEASYLQSWLASKIWGDWRTESQWLWRLSTKHGSHGVLGDVGVHIVDFATFPAGPVKNVFCKLKTFKKAPGNRIGEYKLDANDSAVMTVEFANGAVGVIHATRWLGGHANRLFLKIAGTLGSIEIDSERSKVAYRICSDANLDKAVWEEVEAPPALNSYDHFIKSIRTGTQVASDFARGAEVQRILDACVRSDQTQSPVSIRIS